MGHRHFSTGILLDHLLFLYWYWCPSYGGLELAARVGQVALLCCLPLHTTRIEVIFWRLGASMGFMPSPSPVLRVRTNLPFFLLFLIYIHHPSQEIGEAVGTEKCCCRSMVLPWVFFWLGTRSPTHYGRDLSLLSAFGRTAVFWAHALSYVTLFYVTLLCSLCSSLILWGFSSSRSNEDEDDERPARCLVPRSSSDGYRCRWHRIRRCSEGHTFYRPFLSLRTHLCRCVPLL